MFLFEQERLAEAVKAQISLSISPAESESPMYNNTVQNLISFLLHTLLKSKSLRASMFHPLDVVISAADAFHEQISALESARKIDQQISQTSSMIVCDLEAKLSTINKEF